MKMCEQILKKKTAPQYNSNSLNCKKNQEHRNIAPLSLQLRSYKKGNFTERYFSFFYQAINSPIVLLMRQLYYSTYQHAAENRFSSLCK